MARPRLRRYLLATGAGLAAAYASVSDFTGVIHRYYSDNSTRGAPTPVPPGAAAPTGPAKRNTPASESNVAAVPTGYGTASVGHARGSSTYQRAYGGQAWPPS